MNPNETEETEEPEDNAADLDTCPRCGEPLAEIVWGQTNCPNCGLHFECC